MAGALLGKLTGFARELELAHVLGASVVTDSFRAATAAVLLPIAILQNEAIPAVLIPMYREWEAQGCAPRRLAQMTAALCLVAAGLMAAVEIAGPAWVGLIVSGFGPEGRAQTLDFLRVMALAMPASTLVNCLAAGEIATGRSRLAALRAACLNLSLIGGITIAASTGHLGALAWSFVFAFNALGAWGLVSLWRKGLLDFGGCGARAIWASGTDFLRRSRALLILPITEQGQVWLEKLAASRFAVGTVASLDFARTLTDSAVLLISQPVGMAVLSQGATVDTGKAVEGISRPVLAVAGPASAFLVAFAPDIVRVVFARGAFDETAVRITGEALRGIAFGLWAGTLGWILIRLLNNGGRNFRAALILSSAYGANALIDVVAGIWAAGGEGSFVLGFGETIRSLVLLGGTVVALGCTRAFLRLAALAVPGTVLMGLLGLLIDGAIGAALPRVGAGCAACLASMAVSALILVPALRNPLAVRSAIGLRLSRSGGSDG